MIYDEKSLYKSSVVRSTAANVLASRIRDMRTDITNGKAFLESNPSMLVRALAVTSQKGYLTTSVFSKGESNGG